MVRLPSGVLIVGILTMLSSFALALLFLIYVLVLASPYNYRLPIEASFSLLLAVFSFSSSIVIFNGGATRYFRYSLLAYWILLLAYFVWFYASGGRLWPTGVWSLMFNANAGVHNVAINSLIILLPFFYAVGCIVYFLTETPKRYFQLE